MRSPGDAQWRALVTFYLAGLLSANALAAKLIDVFGVAVTAGALAIPIVYLTTDVINELYGPEATRQVVWMGLWANIVLVIMTFVCGATPASKLGASQESYNAMFAITPRVVFASMVAYLTSSMLDVQIFHGLRKLTKDKHFWLRKNGSTVVSQFVDAVIFMVLAFGGLVPWKVLPLMVAGEYVIKIAAAPLGTPLSYAVLRWIRVEERS